MPFLLGSILLIKKYRPIPEIVKIDADPIQSVSNP